MSPAGERRAAGAGWVAPLLALVAVLAVAPGAPAQEPLEVEAEQVRLAAPAGGKAALLAPVRYPIHLAGQRVELRLNVRGARGWRGRALANAGALRSPERRRGFTFVHEIALGAKTARLLKRALARGRRPKLSVYATAVLDMNRDGVTELASEDRESQRLRRAGPRGCGDVGHHRVRPGRQLKIPLPACGAPVRWRVGRGAENGAARVRGGNLVYRSQRRFRGTESILLRGRVRGGGSVTAPVEVKVARRDGVAVRAIGDSVTASTDTTGGRKDVAYTPDYGLAANVSWVAQWANAHGVTDFQNLAVTGSEPADWTAGGRFHSTAQRMAGEGPDYVLMTIGGEPLLSGMLFDEHALHADLAALYRQLLEDTDATVYLMQYPFPAPSSAPLNRVIATVAAEVDPLRAQLQVVTPPQAIGGEAGIHPSAAGHAQMASKVPAPR